MKKTLISIFLIVLLASIVFAAEADEFAEGKPLVDSKVSCDKLTDGQLKAVGEYIMERMHPGEAHEAMDKMMGLEENAELDAQFHIDLARRMYCGQGYGMMRGGMMGYRTGGMMGPGMMNWTSPWGSTWSILTIVFFVGLLLLIWLIVIKLWKEVFGKNK